MKYLLLTTIAAVVLVGCGESQQSTPAPESKPVEPVAEAAKPEPPTAKAPAISIHDAAKKGNIEAVKQHIAAGTNVNMKNQNEMTPLHKAAQYGRREVAELLITKGADVNAKNVYEETPLHYAAYQSSVEVAELLIANGADINAKRGNGQTPIDAAKNAKSPFKESPKEKAAKKEIIDLLRKHGGKTKKELEAKGK